MSRRSVIEGGLVAAALVAVACTVPAAAAASVPTVAVACTVPAAAVASVPAGAAATVPAAAAGAGPAVGAPAGAWGTAINVPGTSPADIAGVTAVSCATGAECTLAGYGLGADGASFVLTEKNGTWGKVRQIPHAPANSEITSLSGPSSRDCLAVGTDHLVAS
jgi:hypothetical protein